MKRLRTSLWAVGRLWHLAHRGGLPIWVRFALYAAIAYVILPFDFGPDILPFVGLLDDAGVLLATFGILLTAFRSRLEKTPQRIPLRASLRQ